LPARSVASDNHEQMRGRGVLLFAMLLALAIVPFSGCRKKRAASLPLPRPPAPVTVAVGDIEEGIASWYGHPYHGRRAANGEVYDMEQLTAAHRTLPFGTMVDVLNLSNSRRVQVRITDRGPFIDGRIIDLSRAAARTIEMIGPGISKVRVQIIALPATIPRERAFSVQVGAFRDRGNADRLRARLEQRYGNARVISRGSPVELWRVLVGSALTFEEAGVMANELKGQVGEAFVVRTSHTN
jgi:rare lipoprotein A